MTKNLSVYEPQLSPNNNLSIHDLVVADIKDRKFMGLAKYGAILQAQNGRNALIDAYQEALDLACYLRQMIAERGNKSDFS
jgi:hypothetical protein